MALLPVTAVKRRELDGRSDQHPLVKLRTARVLMLQTRSAIINQLVSEDLKSRRCTELRPKQSLDVR